MEADLHEIVKRLLPLIQRGRCMAWAGSGLSTPLGYASWRDIVKKLCEKCCGVAWLDAQGASAAELLEKAQECKDADSVEFERVLAEEYGRPIVTERKAYKLMSLLPFRGYITTNLDPLLSQEMEGLQAYPVLRSGKLEENKVASYIHGIARDGKKDEDCEFVFASEDFDRAYSDDSQLRHFLFQMFAEYDVLFLGASLEEPPLLQLLKQTRQVLSNTSSRNPKWKEPHRYILLPTRYVMSEQVSGERKQRDKTREESEEALLIEARITVLRYDPSNTQTHHEIEQLLTLLCDQCSIDLPAPLPVDYGQQEASDADAPVLRQT